jgi:hypothetical protein
VDIIIYLSIMAVTEKVIFFSHGHHITLYEVFRIPLKFILVFFTTPAGMIVVLNLSFNLGTNTRHKINVMNISLMESPVLFLVRLTVSELTLSCIYSNQTKSKRIYLHTFNEVRILSSIIKLSGGGARWSVIALSVRSRKLSHVRKV